MPQNPKKRDYAKEYRDFHGKPEQIANRAKRNAARSIVKKDLGARAVVGKDVDHVKTLKSGGTNARKNLRVASIKVNRGRNN